MAEWQKWLHTYYLRYTHTDDDDDDDNDDDDADDTLIFYSIDVILIVYKYTDSHI